MSLPVLVPEAAFAGLQLLLEDEISPMELKGYLCRAVEHGCFEAARWIAECPGDFATGLVFGFAPGAPDECCEEEGMPWLLVAAA